MRKLENLLKEIKGSVFLFEEVVRLKPSKKKAHQLLAIYSIVASQIKEVTELSKTYAQSITLKERTLVKLLNKNLPKVVDLKALLIALRGNVSLKLVLRLDENTIDSLYALFSQETIELIQSLDPDSIGPKDDYSLPLDQKAVQKKEQQLLKNLENIIVVLQMNVDPDEKDNKLNLESLQKRYRKS